MVAAKQQKSYSCHILSSIYVDLSFLSEVGAEIFVLFFHVDLDTLWDLGTSEALHNLQQGVLHLLEACRHDTTPQDLQRSSRGQLCHHCKAISVDLKPCSGE